MPGVIEIHDTNNGMLSFDLADLLKLLPLNDQQLTWSILDLSQFLEVQNEAPVVGKELLAINEKAHKMPGGYILSWDTLVTYAGALRQVVDGLFIGCKNAKLLSGLSFESSDDDLYSVGEVVIEAVDGSYWTIYSRSDEFLHRCKTFFYDVREVK